MDTPSVLSARVSVTARLMPPRQAWRTQRILPVSSRVSHATAAVLIRGPAYPESKLSPPEPPEPQELPADSFSRGKTSRILEPPPHAPACRDVVDGPCLELALAAKADVPVIAGQGLLVLAGGVACPIPGAEQLIDTLAP